MSNFTVLVIPTTDYPVMIYCLCLCALQPIAVTPQQMASLRQQQQQHSGSGPPPLLLAPRASVPNVQVQGQRIIQQGLIRVANVSNSNVMVNISQVRLSCKRSDLLTLIRSGFVRLT